LRFSRFYGIEARSEPPIIGTELTVMMMFVDGIRDVFSSAVATPGDQSSVHFQPIRAGPAMDIWHVSMVVRGFRRASGE
jgi:hypothetical protein